MIDIDEKHDRAMKLAEEADGLLKGPQKKHEEAYRLEREVLNEMEATPLGRAVVRRSAAMLAYEAGLFKEAVECAEEELDVVPQAGLRAELIDIRCKAWAKLHGGSVISIAHCVSRYAMERMIRAAYPDLTFPVFSENDRVTFVADSPITPEQIELFVSLKDAVRANNGIFKTFG